MIKHKKHDKRKERGHGFFHSLRFLVATVFKRVQKKLWVFLKPTALRDATTKHKKLDKIKEKRYSFTQSLRFLVATVVKPMRKKLWVFLKPNAPSGARSLVMFFSHKNRGQSLATLAVLVTAITLAGCGGGGSGGGVTPPPPLVPVNAVMTVTVTPSDGATNVARDSNVVMTYSVTSGSYTSTTGTLSCDGTSFVLAQTTDTTANKVTFSPSAALPYGSTCIAQGVATATGQNGGSQANISWKSTFSVEQLVCKTGESVSNDGQSCITTPVVVRHYNDLLISYWTHTRSWPQKTASDGSQVVAVNKTTYSDFLSCQPATKPLADGTIPHSCLALFGNDRYKDIVLDPITMELKNSSSVPAGLTYVPLTYDSAYVLASKPTWTTSSQFSTGDYVFVDQTSKNVMRKLSASGIESVVHAGDMAKFETCSRVMVFSNP